MREPEQSRREPREKAFSLWEWRNYAFHLHVVGPFFSLYLFLTLSSIVPRFFLILPSSHSFPLSASLGRSSASTFPAFLFPLLFLKIFSSRFWISMYPFPSFPFFCLYYLSSCG